MVLAELGKKITGALQKFNHKTVIDEEAVKECLKEICNALLASDIDVRYVMKLRDNVTKQMKSLEDEGANIRLEIKKAIIS